MGEDALGTSPGPTSTLCAVATKAALGGRADSQRALGTARGAGELVPIVEADDIAACLDLTA